MNWDSLDCSCRNSYKGNTNAAHPDPLCPYYTPPIVPADTDSFWRPRKPERATPPQQGEDDASA